MFTIKCIYYKDARVKKYNITHYNTEIYSMQKN